jgi:multisubunit Na+/H+ antiporter MnhC subunit
MPLESILFLTAVLLAFAIFSVVLLYAEAQSKRAQRERASLEVEKVEDKFAKAA